MAFPSFSSTAPITYQEGDCFDSLRPSALVGRMWVASTQNVGDIGLPRQQLYESHGAVFMIIRLAYRLRRVLRVGEMLSVTTWCRGSKGPYWYRDFSFRVGDEPVGGAVTAWVTVRPEDGRIVRPGDILPKDKLAIDPADTMPFLTKLTLPPALEPVGTHPVLYSDLDTNRHLNHVKAVDILSSAAKLHRYPEQFVSTCQVQYEGQCMPEEELTLCSGAVDNTLYARASVDGRWRVESALTLSPR